MIMMMFDDGNDAFSHKGSKSQGNTFASKFVGHTSAVCGIQAS